MKGFDFEQALFSVKTFAAAMLAYYIALRIGLVRPFWAVTTTYLISQPLSGSVMSKGVFRLAGTVFGAAAAVVLVPNLVNSPAVLSLALAGWLGLCIYIGSIDRTPRSYAFLLAGYTASIIGFPSVTVPGEIFNIAILRVQEITIGIVTASLVHGVILPRTVTKQIVAKIDALIKDTEQWTRETLQGAHFEALDPNRRRLALAVSELHQLSIHLPFDNARFVPQVRTVRALQAEVAAILPNATTLEDRLGQLTKSEQGVPDYLNALTKRFHDWLASPSIGNQAGADQLISDARAIEPALSEGWTWHDLLVLNALARLADLIAAHRNLRELREQIRSPGAMPISELSARLLARASNRALHLDRGMAVRNAAGTITIITLACSFWIMTAWADGAGAVLITGIACALFGARDDSVAATRTFFYGSLIGTVVSAFYAFAVIPFITSFDLLIAVLAPVLLVLGSMLARPPMILMALGAIVGVLNNVGLNATYTASFYSFINGAIAQNVGTLFVVAALGLFTLDNKHKKVVRLLKACFNDVSLRADGRANNMQRWSSRMLDRVGIIASTWSLKDFHPGAELFGSLLDLRTGIIAGELHNLSRAALGEERSSIATCLDGVSRFFRMLDPASPKRPPVELLDDIDIALNTFAEKSTFARRRDGLVLLTSLRCNLFPGAPPYLDDAK